jgi:AraC-like DNA-binding protein
MEREAPRYREYAVHATLAPYVKCIWSLESDGAIYDAPRERILPDSCVELVFHFADPFRSHFADGESSLQPQSFVVGQMRRFLEIEPSGRIGMLAVRFHAHGAYRFFSQPLREVTNGVVDLRHVWEARATELTERVAIADGPRGRLKVLECALLQSLRAHDRHDRAVDRALQRIDLASGQTKIAELASELGLSCRHLTRRFEHAVGLAPKEFVRISRFLHGVRRLRRKADPTLTETALECGYYDQAHFNHDFRRFAGMTPSDFLISPNVVF